MESKFKLTKFDDRPARAFNSFFAASFTEVQAAHYHESCLSKDLAASWNKVVEGKQKTDSDLFVSPDLERRRFFTELDMKVKPMDIILSADVMTPFTKLMKEIVSVALHENERMKKCRPIMRTLQTPIWTSGNMPLAYLNSGRIRLFLKTSCTENPNTLIVQIPSMSLTSQVRKNKSMCSCNGFRSFNEIF